MAIHAQERHYFFLHAPKETDNVKILSKLIQKCWGPKGIFYACRTICKGTQNTIRVENDLTIFGNPFLDLEPKQSLPKSDNIIGKINIQKSLNITLCWSIQSSNRLTKIISFNDNVARMNNQHHCYPENFYALF